MIPKGMIDAGSACGQKSVSAFRFRRFCLFKNAFAFYLKRTCVSSQTYLRFKSNALAFCFKRRSVFLGYPEAAGGGRWGGWLSFFLGENNPPFFFI